MKKIIYPLILFLLFCFLPKSYAANFTVTDTSSLRAAITAANTNGVDDVITFANNIDITIDAANPVVVIDGNNGLPSILNDGSLTIEGAGFTLRRPTAGGTPAFRLMHIGSGANVFINDLTLENGLASAGGLGTLGGAIYSSYATLTINNSIISNNTATTVSGFGGGIFANHGTLEINDSTFTGNNASTGGALHNYVNTATLTGNTFYNNTATYGGGAIGDESAVSVTMVNNTLSGNSAPSGYGGAINHLGGPLTMTNNTLSNNSAGNGGGGIYNLAGTITLRNNIIAGNTASSNAECYNDTIVGGTVMNGNSYNVFGTSSSAGGCPNGATDIVPAGAIATILDTTLQDNNGPTFTHALILGSEAIDAANNANCPTTDQRGFLRGFDGDGTVNIPEIGDCDIGAFEYSLDPGYSSLPAVGSTINLGSTTVGTEISTTLEISETGGAALIVSLNTITGTNAADFTVIGLPTTIGNGNAPQDIAIICTPSGTGLRTATITFNTNDPTQTTVSYNVQCTGIGTVVASVSMLDINQFATEGNTSLTVTVQLDVPAGFADTGDITVDVIDAAMGNATSGTDYTAFPLTTLTFAGPLTAGTTTSQDVTVDLLDDPTIEGAEYLALQLTNVTGAAEIKPSDSHTIVINDNDANVYAQASFVGNSLLVDEAAGTMSIDVQLFIPAGFNQTGNVTVTITDALTGNATSGTDYSAFGPVTLTFVDAPFVVGTPYTQTITIPIIDDTAVEGAETIELAITGISGPVELVSPASFTGIINDDEIATVVVNQPGSTETVFVHGDTDFVFKTVDNPFATVGQTVTYTIRARNPKTIPLTQVVIYDVFDERLTDIQLVSTTHGTGAFNANTLTVSGFTLQPGEEAVIVVSARIASLRSGETIPNAAILESPNASVHVSNLALVGDNVEGNNGGAAQVFIVPSQLPATGEAPLWRWALLAALGLVLASGIFVLVKRQTTKA